MSDQVIHSEAKPIQGTPQPEAIGPNQHAPLSPNAIRAIRRFYEQTYSRAELSDSEFIEQLAAARDQRIIAGLGRAASWQEVTVAEMVHAQSPHIENVLITGDIESQNEIAEITLAYADTVADTIVASVNDVYSFLQRQKVIYAEGSLMPSEPASRLLLAGKFIAAIVQEESTEEDKNDPHSEDDEAIVDDEVEIRRMLDAVVKKEQAMAKAPERDHYVHADEGVSILRNSLRIFNADIDAETLDAFSFIEYIHDTYKKIRDKEGRYLEDRTIITSPLVVKCVLEKLGIEPDRVTEIITAYQLMTQLPGPDESSEKYYEYIENGCKLGGNWFIIPKLACVIDMIQLEEDSPLKKGQATNKTDKFYERVHAWTILSKEAFYNGYGMLPGIMEQMTHEDIKRARVNKSHFDLEEAARTVIEKINDKK